MNQPFITIGIASYNYSQYLLEAFEAIKRQSFTDFELLYADDGSTDDSVEIITKIIADNPQLNIRLLSGHNLGVSGNKQRIIDNAFGKYVMLCDADDWMEDNCLAVLADVAIATDADRIVSEIRKVNGTTDGTINVQKFSRYPSKWCEVLHHGTLYKLSTIRDNNIHMIDSTPDDFLFILQFNLFAESTVFVRRCIYNWRIHSDSESNKNKATSDWRGSKLLNNMISFLNELNSSYPDRITAEDRTMIQAYLIKCYYYYLLEDIAPIEPYSAALSEYKIYRQFFSEHVENYLDNKYLSFFEHSPFRFQIKTALFILSHIEKMNLMCSVLRIYGYIHTNWRPHHDTTLI